MALEVIGGIASIAQLAGAVYTISRNLYEVSEALANAPSDIKDLARDLETFSEELRLLSTLINGKDGCWADQVYQLTAKIIGDCAIICTKIDRIIRKLRTGSVWAKVRWLYKEKEIMKLLTRLRDLKLSLMGTLSVLSALRADYMMDSLGIQHASLLEGDNNKALSTETLKEIEDTRMKLAGISVKGSVVPNLTSSGMSLQSNPSSLALNSSASAATYVASSSSASTFATPLFTSVAIPKDLPMQNMQALESVDSFHSAISYQNHGQASAEEAVQSAVVRMQQDSTKVWREETAAFAMKNFGMDQSAANTWAMSLPIPDRDSQAKLVSMSFPHRDSLTHGRMVQGHIVPDGYSSRMQSAAATTATPATNTFTAPKNKSRKESETVCGPRATVCVTPRHPSIESSALASVPSVGQGRSKPNPAYSARYARTLPRCDSVGELWLRAFKTMASNNDKVVTFIDHLAAWSLKPHKDIITTLCHALPDASNSIKRILEILGVMEDTLGFKSGIIAWACFCSATETVLGMGSSLGGMGGGIFSDKQRVEIFAHLAEIASIIARYTVMESIYSQWKGMSLDKSDAACRGFSAVIHSDNISDESLIDDISDDSDISEVAIAEQNLEDQQSKQDMEPPAKRVKL